jgi:NitT/TauT family transport system permease protein
LLDRLRRLGYAVLGLALVVALWEGYKAIDGQILGWQLPLEADDQRMPHVATMIERLGDPERRGSDRSIAAAVLAGGWYTFQIALAGLLGGIVVGSLLAALMQRLKVAERAVLPLVVMSQTVPIVAFAPLVAAWGGRLKLGSGEWQPWMSVAVISAFLAFAPVAVGLLRGLQSAPPAAEELMRSMAAPPRVVLWKLRLPSALPYLVPALRLSAAGAVVGAIVAEISLGRSGGIGRLTLEYSRAATSDPAKVYTALMGAALLGIAMALLVSAVDAAASRNRPKEHLAG